MIQLVRPCRGHVTQRYGNIQSHDGRKHTGQDYAYYSDGKVMDEVFAAADGVVVYAGDARNLGWPNPWYLNPDFDRSDRIDTSAGNIVVIRHRQAGVSFDTTYNHLQAFSVRTGDSVKAGQRIATIGETGYSAGKHLHFELLIHPFNFGTDTYGRTDPNPHFITGIAALGGTTITAEDDDEMFSAEGQKWLRDNLLTKADGATLRADTEWQNGHLFSKEDGAWQNGLLADISARLGSTLTKEDGGYIVGLLDSLRPGNTDAAGIADAVVAAVGTDLASAVAEELGKRLAK